jgi:hypothetical protein
MPSLLRGSLLLVVLGAMAPAAAKAQFVGGAHRGCLRGPHHCTCTSLRPVLGTRYTNQSVLTYRDFSQTEYRTQAHLETVPVTTYGSVIVDEGNYVPVWVPKLVTKHVPRTEYQQRLSYRTVPYQTIRRVPQLSTRLVPQTHFRYVPQQTHIVLNSPILAQATPSSMIAQLPVAVAQLPVAVARPVPHPKFLETPSVDSLEQWTTDRPRLTATHTLDERLDGYFVRAPSAAAVWQTRRTNRR